MSGGHFNYCRLTDDARGAWCDEELNELIDDLFFNGTFAVRDYGGLFQSLDFMLSGDTGPDDYKKAVAGFKCKWLNRTPKKRYEFYSDKLQEYCDELKQELSELASDRCWKEG